MHPDHVGSTTRITSAVGGIFHEPSPNGECMPPPSSPLPGVPGMPADFEPPCVDEHLRPDAERGAGTINAQ